MSAVIERRSPHSDVPSPARSEQPLRPSAWLSDLRAAHATWFYAALGCVGLVALCLVGIAMDSGFNSKATFNRVFKKLTSMSPSEFVNTINK